MFCIVSLSAILWVTEAIPLFLTSLIAMILLVIFRVFSFKEAIVSFADPLLVLFFGGFLVAASMQKISLDKKIALKISSKFRDDRYALLGMMMVTAFLSMWISNTATTVLMVPIALGIVHKFKKEMPNFNKAAVLGIAYAANIGGVGTILGSPPNGIAVSKLSEISQIHMSFFDWFISTIPLVIVLIPIAWLVLLKLFPFDDLKLKNVKNHIPLNLDQKKFLVVFVLAIFLLLTTSYTGLSSALVLLMASCALFLLRLLDVTDLNRVNYYVLILFGGGLVLGSAMYSTGLSDYFASHFANLLSGSSSIVVMLGIVFLSIILSSLTSNSASAAILVPVLIPLSSVLGFSPKLMVMLSAVSVSFAFLLPISTPPNAIAYGTGLIKMKDMLKAGSILTLISVLAVLGMSLFW